MSPRRQPLPRGNKDSPWHAERHGRINSDLAQVVGGSSILTRSSTPDRSQMEHEKMNE